MSRFKNCSNSFISATSTSTILVLKNQYTGNSTAGASFTIGQVPILPEDYQDLPLYRMGLIYYTTRFPDATRAQLYQGLWDTGEEKLNEEFLYYQLKFIIEKIKKSGSGTTFNEISKPKAANILIKVPIINIQIQIVQGIDSRFSVADKVGEIVDDALLKGETLRKSILKAAFEGNLIN